MGDDAKAPLQVLGELVGGAFHGSAVKGITDILRLPPLGGLLIEELHDRNGKIVTSGFGVAHTLHAVDTLTQTCIAQRDGAVVVVEQSVDLLTLAQAADGTVLPKDGGHIGGCTQQRFMPDAQCLMAKLRAFLHQLPELLLVPFCAIYVFFKEEINN